MNLNKNHFAQAFVMYLNILKNFFEFQTILFLIQGASDKKGFKWSDEVGKEEKKWYKKKNAKFFY